MPKIPNKKVCQDNAENFATAVQKVISSGRLQDLIDAFENDDKNEFKKILNEIPDIDIKIKDMMNEKAWTNTTVSFTWF